MLRLLCIKLLVSFHFFKQEVFVFDVRIFSSVRKTPPLLLRRFFPSKMGCNSVERVVMRDVYSHHRALEEQRHAAAGGKEESASLSLFMEVNDLAAEEEHAAMATLAWAEGVWLGKCGQEQL